MTLAIVIILLLAVIMVIGGLGVTCLIVFTNGMQPTYNGFEGGAYIVVALVVAVLGVCLGFYGWGLN